MRRRARGPAVEVAPGEKVLATALTGSGGVVAGTRDALYLSSSVAPPSSVEPVEPVETVRLPWEQVEAADWDRDTETFRVSEVGTWGEQRVEHVATLEDPARLLQLVRERVTASVVLQRHVAVEGRRGLRVIARRAPRGDRPITWFYQYDEGVDPADPAVAEAARTALAAARDEVGTGPALG